MPLSWLAKVACSIVLRICKTFVALTPLAASTSVFAQSAHENAVTEATDAFGLTIGREEVGIYSATNARGFDPSRAGNLRIDGLYFDQVSRLASHLVHGSSVHVGVSAQGFLFPAPTGVVDFRPRSLEGDAAGTARLGYTSYGNQAYGELDIVLPKVADTLSVGAGFGYSLNSSYNIASRTDEWTIGAMARWQPAPSLEVMPFWGMTSQDEKGEKSHVFIGNAGFPEFRGVDLMAQPWADFSVTSRNFGVIARYGHTTSWALAAGVFRSESKRPLNYDPLLLDTDRLGRGDYFISAAPPRRAHSTSGELRLSRYFETGAVRHGIHVNLKGRSRSGESGGADLQGFGPGTVHEVPQVTSPDFHPGPTTRVDVRQLTPGLAYQGVWEGVGQLTLGVQQPFYRRERFRPEAPAAFGRGNPWLYNVAAAAFLSSRLVAYASVTRGFEEIGDAPLNAVNQGEAVAAQVTEQLDAGIQYRIHERLFALLGTFDINKPYFDLDQQEVFRHVGSTQNRGVELSLTGNLTDELTVVAGAIFIDASVRSEIDGTRVAVGPIPRQILIDLQYSVPRFAGLTLSARIENIAERYARPEIVQLPSVTLLDVGVRYDTRILNRNVTVQLRGTNLTNEFGLTPEASGKINPFDARSLDLSLAFDL